MFTELQEPFDPSLIQERIVCLVLFTILDWSKLTTTLAKLHCESSLQTKYTTHLSENL